MVLLFFDCTERLSKVDKQLAHYIAEQYKPCIMVVNKWDKLVGQMPTERWVRYLRENFPTMAYCPIAFITGETGKNVKTLLNHAQMLFKQANSRVSTPQLNKLFKAAMEKHEPALVQMKRPKIYYATQIATAPPTMVAMCNNPQGFTTPYKRYLLTFLRDHLPFGEVPIKLYLQQRSRDDERDEVNPPRKVQTVKDAELAARQASEGMYEEGSEEYDDLDLEGTDLEEISMEFDDSFENDEPPTNPS